VANTWTEVIPKLLAQGLMALRQQAIMPRLVNRTYDTLAGELGSTIDIPIPSAVTVGNVAPSNTPPSTGDSAPTKVSIALDQWKEAAFYLTDKELLEVMRGTIPMQASEAVKALANTIDSAILAQYVNIYGYAGSAGSAPFSSDPQDYLDARKVLADQLAPMDPRNVVLDPGAEANALALRAFQDASFGGGSDTIINGQIGRKMGALWVMDQNVPTHTAGTAAGATTNAAGYALGVKTVTLAVAGTGTILAGDVFTFAGDSQTYVVVTGDSDVSDGGTVVFEPGLKQAIPASATGITLKGSHVVNLLLHRDAFALAMRPFAGSDPLALGNFSSAVDPVSGLALRLEVTREHKRTRFAYDVLYGVATIRPEFAARIAG
jgi:hypothetical protein